MRRAIIISAAGLLLASCSERKAAGEGPVAAPADTAAPVAATTLPATRDTSVWFLSWEAVYDKTSGDSVTSLRVNEAYCKTITDPERAALGYVATFVGSECQWDGDANPEFSNLKCKALDALGLGYQCSPQHLGFLRKWFRGDKKSLEALESCPVVPFTATIQNTFEAIDLVVKGNIITVSYKAHGVNIRESDSWTWTETDRFEFGKDDIRLVRTDKTEAVHEKVTE